MNLYNLATKYGTFYFLANSYKEAEDLCKLKNSTLSSQEIKFVTDKIIYNKYCLYHELETIYNP